jgi:secreted PhoX family phosphatase
LNLIAGGVKMAISRREFLKGSAGVAALAAMGDLFFNLSEVVAKE